jgi:competence protein ComEC
MGQGLRWILYVAHAVSDLDGARGAVVTPQAAVLPMLALAALWIMLWQGRLRWIAVAPLLLALGLWTMTERPFVLISGDGGLVGVMTAQGRALSQPRGAAFVAQGWLDHDGQAMSQETAAAMWRAPMVLPDGGRIIHLRGKTGAAQASCMENDWLVMNTTAPKGLPCRVFDAVSLRSSGAVALYLRDGALVAVTSRDVTGDRLWNHRPAPQERPKRQ